VNILQSKYSEEIEKILAKYPPDQKRSAVMPMLFLAQREDGFVSEKDKEDIAEILDLTATEVSSIVGFYTLFHDKPGGKYRIQVCNDLPCAMRGADTFLNALCKELNIKPGETTQDGLVTVEAVMCLAACDKAPMFQVQTGDGLTYHELQSVESTMELIESWKTQEVEKQEAA
jgi:NADH-quinone oxidoreductase subunit E